MDQLFMEFVLLCFGLVCFVMLGGDCRMYLPEHDKILCINKLSCTQSLSVTRVLQNNYHSGGHVLNLMLHTQCFVH